MIESQSFCDNPTVIVPPRVTNQLLLIRPSTGKPAGTFSDRPIFNALKQSITRKKKKKGGMIQSHRIYDNIHDSCLLL